MSVFRVSLGNPGGNLVSSEGNLDVDMITGMPVATSIQRTVFVAGPNKIYRKLKDGQTFTDSNYWKQFTTAENSLGFAFLTLVSDDGSVYDPQAKNQDANTFPRTYINNVAAGTTFTSNAIDIIGDNGGPAIFTQINNNTVGKTVKVRLNGSTNSVFDLSGGSSQIFNANELQVTRIEFDYSTSGAAGTVQLETILSVKSSSKS